MTSGRAIPGVTPARPWQLSYLMEDRILDPLDHQLGDPVSAPEADRAAAICIEQDDLDFSTVPGVYRARRVDYGHPVPGRQPRARVHKSRVTLRQGDGDAGGYKHPLAGAQFNIHRGIQVDAGVARVRTTRQRQLLVQPPDQNLDPWPAHYPAPPGLCSSGPAGSALAHW